MSLKGKTLFVTGASRGIGLALALLAVCAGAAVAAPALPVPAAIDAEARRLMAAEDVKGLALAVIDDGKIVHVAAFGGATSNANCRSKPTRSCTARR